MPKSDSEPELLRRYHDNFSKAVCEAVKMGCDQSAMVTANADRSVYSLIYPDPANDEAYLLVGDGSGLSVWQQLKKINLATQCDQITIYYLSSGVDGATMTLHTLQLRFNLKSDPVANATDRAYLDSWLKDCPPDTSDAEIKKHFIPTVCQVRQSSQCFSGDHVVAISKKIVTCLTNEWSGCLTQLVMKREEDDINRQDEMIAREMSDAPQGGDAEFEDHFEEPYEARAVAQPSMENSLFKSVSSLGRNGQEAGDAFLRDERASLAEVLKISCRDLISALNERKWNVVHLYKKQPTSVIEMVDYLENMIKSTKPFTERDVLNKLQEIADKHSGQKRGRHPTTITFIAIVVSARNLQEIINDIKEIDTQPPRPSGQ